MSALERQRVITGQVVDYRLETWTDSRYALQAQIQRATKRGQVAQVSHWVPVRGCPGWYSVQVRRLKDPPPRWRPWAIGAGVALVVLGALVALTAYLIAAVATALMVVPAWVWGLLVLLLLAGGTGGARVVTVKVWVR